MIHSFSSNLIAFSILRLSTMIYTKRKQLKNMELLYTYYVSFFFQIILLPLLNVGYFFDIISYQTIINSAINYFITDLPEVVYNKQHSYLAHHFISITTLFIAKYLHPTLYQHSLINLLLLEFGSSILSLPVIFKQPFLYKTRPYIFLLSRILTIINTINLLKLPLIQNYTRCVLIPLSILLIYNNFKTFLKLYKKNVKYNIKHPNS